MRDQLRQKAGAIGWSLLLVVALVTMVVGTGAAEHHHDERWPAMPEGTTFQNMTMYLYNDSPRTPGADGVSIWYEVIVHGLPDDNREAWLNQTVSATPWAGACEINNLVHFGIDRGPDTENGTGGGTTTYYASQTESHVTSVDTDPSAGFDTTDEEGVARYREYLQMDTPAEVSHHEFPLSSNGFDAGYLHTSSTKFWDKQQADNDQEKTRFSYKNGDRVIVDYQDCYVNPPEAGWYRQTSLSETYWVDERDTAPEDHSVGAPENQNYSPVTYSHWMYICDCDSYDAAVSQLGPPPEMNGTKVANPEEFAAYYGQEENTPTATPQATDTPTPTATETEMDTPTATPTETEMDTPTATTTPTEEMTTTEATTEQQNTNGGGPGFGIGVAVVALLGAALLALRRRD